MVTSGSPMRVAVVCSIEVFDSIRNVVGGMRVDDIHNDPQPQGVGFVYQVLEVVRRPRSGRHGEKACHVVPKGGVVGVLLDRHQLDHIVSCVFDSLQVVVREFSVGAHSPKLLSHSHMGLVNPNTLCWNGHWPFVRPLELLWRVPKNTIEQESVWILNLVSGPGRVSVFPLSIGSFDLNLVLRVVRNLWRSVVICFDCKIEASKAIFFANVLVSIPVVEVTEEFHAFRVGRPLFESQVSVWLKVQAVLFVTSANLNQPAFCIFESLEPSTKLNYKIRVKI